MCSLMSLCVYVGVTDQSGILWPTSVVCCFELPSALEPRLRCFVIHVGSEPVKVGNEMFVSVQYMMYWTLDQSVNNFLIYLCFL